MYLGKAKKLDIPGSVMGLIAPHAGYMFSGQTAAHAYKQVTGREYDAVIVVAPSHQEYFQGATVYEGKGYETPLGVVAVDQGLADKLAGQGKTVTKGRAGHGLEHSLEVQLPFLQTVLKGVPMVPLVMGDQDLGTSTAVAQAIIASQGKQKFLLVGSSDLSHFHSYDKAKTLDAEVNRYIDAFDPPGLARALEQGSCEACGGGPLAAVMLAARQMGANQARVVHHVNSGDITGDKSGVVGYSAGVIYQE
jgi:AmmeMemoRadiSam system protein B